MTPSTGRVVAAVVALSAGLSGCASAPAEAPAEADVVRAEGIDVRVVTLEDAASAGAVADAVRALGVETLSLAPREGNVVLSPSSLGTALAMLADGADGATLADLERVLGASGEERRDAFAALRGDLAELDGDPVAAAEGDVPDGPIVHIADQVVVDDGFSLRDSYLEALADGFDAGVQHADLGSDAGIRVLDDWVRTNSGGLIEKSAIQADADLRLVLQDALVLAARWQTPFPFEQTAGRSFTLGDGTVIESDAMLQNEAAFASAEVDGWQAVRLPYTEALHADLLLPPAGTDPAELTPELLRELASELDAATPAEIEVQLPVLGLAPEPLDLSGLLPNLGLASLGCGSADLSGIGQGDLCVGQAMQSAVLRVDEDGTVAAAVTELGVVETAARVPDRAVHFDRPFVFTVVHDDTDLPLIVAAVRDPRG
ncbi:serpin family protein [Microbacterium fluvii]|uniref:Serpin family protein n=1 Tax=Microbacterium fluvii TaxID=415215 RepID=A0ABW2HEJ5_9MICO|nr:serpin family protein [Microbacterium fluvii]MCU4671986.1 serpin family protein [Microbacterium fluvii]